MGKRVWRCKGKTVHPAAVIFQTCLTTSNNHSFLMIDRSRVQDRTWSPSPFSSHAISSFIITRIQKEKSSKIWRVRDSDHSIHPRHHALLHGAYYLKVTMIPKEIEDDREERADRRLKPWSWDGYRSARVSHLFHHLSHVSCGSSKLLQELLSLEDSHNTGELKIRSGKVLWP